MKSFLLFSILFLNWTVGTAQCTWPDSVSSLYKVAAYQTVFEKAYATGDTAVTQEVILPEDSMKMVLNLMGCVYNQTGGARDSIFQPNTFQFLNYRYSENSAIYEFGFSESSGLPYADSLYMGKKTGISTLDSLIDKYNLSFNLKDFNGLYNGTIHSTNPVNTTYLSDLMNTASGTSDFWAVNYIGDGNNITFRRSGDTLLLKFSFRWGDCFGGCMHYKNLTYKFYDSAKIHGPYYADNIPDLPPGPHYITSNRKIKPRPICSNTDRITNYYPGIPFPFAFYMGKPWGRWIVNGTDRTVWMETHQTLSLQDSGTFYISHIPTDSNGVWYHDTFRVNLYQVPNGIISQDTLEFCPYQDYFNYYRDSLNALIDKWLQDSIAALSWNFTAPNFRPDSMVKKIALMTTSSKFRCELHDTVHIQAIFYPGNISRNLEQQCLYTPAVFKPYYPVKSLKCNSHKQDSVCYYYGPDWGVVTYDYLGCPVRESLMIALRNAPRIPLLTSYSLSGYDSLVLDAGNSWKTVTWNGALSQQKFTFKGQNQNRKDTVFVRAEEQNGCFDTLNIVIDQSAVASVRSTLASNIKVYPNPAGQSLNIETSGQVAWVIYDLQARPMLRGKGNAVIDLGDWTPGLYVLHSYGNGSGPILFEIAK